MILIDITTIGGTLFRLHLAVPFIFRNLRCSLFKKNKNNNFVYFCLIMNYSFMNECYFNI
jgi:hypothetical protein